MRRRGFTLVELVVTIVVLAVVLTIALPLWRQMHMAGNEARVIEKLRAISRAIDSFRMQGGLGGTGVPLSMADLTSADPPYLQPAQVGGGQRGPMFFQDGYIWTYLPGAAQLTQVGNLTYSIRQTYRLWTVPENRGVTGQRTFYTDESGGIRYDATGGPDPNDPLLEQQS